MHMRACAAALALAVIAWSDQTRNEVVGTGGGSGGHSFEIALSLCSYVALPISSMTCTYSPLPPPVGCLIRRVCALPRNLRSCLTYPVTAFHA